MTFNIGDFIVGRGATYVIAEIGNNHNGSFDLAIEMIDRTKKTGANAIKFQMRHLDDLYRKKTLSKDGEDLGTEYLLDLLSRFELTIEEHLKLHNYCNQHNIQYLCTPWDLKSVDVLSQFGDLPAYKVASADLTNIPLLSKLINTKKPLILSTGMSTESEIIKSADYLKSYKTKFALLHCNSTYPAPLQDINLNWLKKLKKIHSHIGYSGHERGIAISLAAVALGAEIIERHITLDRNMEGPDHAASLTFNEFESMVNGIREIEIALGTGKAKSISQGEMINRENLGKSLIAATNLKKGTIVEPKHIKTKSPGKGLSPQHYPNLIGKVLKRDMIEEDFFYISDITDTLTKPQEKYKFSRPWGIPVRYHDINEYALRISPDLWEFHLSYNDMELNPKDFIQKNDDVDIIVHAPELFKNSHLLDLASPDEDYRIESIKQMQRVIEITKEINTLFQKTKRPLIVTNIGGFSMDSTISDDLINDYYLRFAESIKSLNLSDVELIPQTMAPFPWHFGGQRYQNLFVKPEEIVFWCKELNIRMCLDVSHSKLTCNHFGLNFEEFCKSIAPHTAHIHFGDAKGVNGEGLQINEGEINFSKLATVLNTYCPNASFIPEIWQGHKNGGEGFWIALERLSNYF